MRLRTDDDIYRARLVYLGPPGYTLPFQVPYAQYGVFIALVAVFMAVRYLITWRISLFPAWELCAAMICSAAIFRYVDPDRPARKVLSTVASDWRHVPEPTSDQRLPRLSGAHIVIREADHP